MVGAAADGVAILGPENEALDVHSDTALHSGRTSGTRSPAVGANAKKNGASSSNLRWEWPNLDEQGWHPASGSPEERNAALRYFGLDLEQVSVEKRTKW